jgi:hypothetical protein
VTKKRVDGQFFLSASNSLKSSIGMIKLLFIIPTVNRNVLTEEIINSSLLQPLVIAYLCLERQKCYGLDKKILFKNQLFDLDVKGQGPTKVITLLGTPLYGHAPTLISPLTSWSNKSNKTLLEDSSYVHDRNDLQGTFDLKVK